jgi:hypothetical protein
MEAELNHIEAVLALLRILLLVCFVFLWIAQYCDQIIQIQFLLIKHSFSNLALKNK